MAPSLYDRLAAQRGEQLLALAHQVFGEELNDAETALFRSLGMLDAKTLIGLEGSEENLPVLRADRVAWLLIDPQAREFLTPLGIKIESTTIQGKLDISFCEADLPLILLDCDLKEGLTLSDARLVELRLSCSRSGPIVADRINVKGSIFLRNVITKGEIRFPGADVGGDLECNNASLNNPRGDALNADGINIKGGVFLRSATTKGEVRLLGADVGADLDCNEATLNNPKGYTLHADGIKVKGTIFLQNTIAEGEIQLLNANVGGVISCIGATLKSMTGIAFNADSTKVKGSVFLRDKFTSKGEVRLLNAEVGGNLDCTEGEFENTQPEDIEKRKALSADGIKVTGDVVLRGATSKGEVWLPGADVGGNLECDGASLENLDGRALTTDGIKVKGNVFLRNKFKAYGLLVFTNTTIEGWLHIHGLNNPEQAELHLTGARVGMLWDEKNSWPEVGKLHLDNFHYDRIYKDAPLDVKNRLEWLKLQPKGEFSSQPYEQLAKVYREAGREEDARKVLYAKSEHRAECICTGDLQASNFEKIGLDFTDLLVGYGYKPWRAVAALAGLIAVGAMVYFIFGDMGMISSTTLNPTLNGIPLIEFSPLFYSIDSAIPLVELGQTAAWTITGPAQIWFTFETLAGWVIVLLLVGALTGLIKK